MLWRKISILYVLLVITGCEFTPLLSYQQNGSKELGKIKISVIENRLGQILHNHLMNIMAPSGQSEQPFYLLEVILSEHERGLSFRKDLTPKRSEIHLRANFTLKNLKTNKTLYSGGAEGYDTYSIVANTGFAPLSSLISNKDSKKRLARLLAQDIKLQLANFLNKHPSGFYL
jgi:LPS-assembly lipoprotein